MKKNVTFVSFAGMLTGMCSKSTIEREADAQQVSMNIYVNLNTARTRVRCLRLPGQGANRRLKTVLKNEFLLCGVREGVILRSVSRFSPRCIERMRGLTSSFWLPGVQISETRSRKKMQELAPIAVRGSQSKRHHYPVVYDFARVRHDNSNAKPMSRCLNMLTMMVF